MPLGSAYPSREPIAGLFLGDNTGATDVSAAFAAHHDGLGHAVLPPGTYLLNAALTRVPRIRALIPGTVKILHDNTTPAITFSPPVAEVLGDAVAVTAIAAAQNAGYDDVCDRITVASIPAGLKTGDLIHITSNDSLPSAANRWVGEAAIVAFIDRTNNYIFTAMPLANTYTTSPLLSRFTMQHRDGFIRGVTFSANGDYLDQSISTRAASLDIAGAPFFEIGSDVRFDKIWGISGSLRACPGLRCLFVRNLELLNLPTYDPTATPKTITAATAASPGVFTSNAHGFSNGNWVYVAGGSGPWADLAGKCYNIVNRATNTFQLLGYDGTAVDTSGFAAYAGDLTVALADVTGLGYGAVQIYGPSAFAEIVGSYTTQSRHDATDDGRGATYSTTTYRHLQGQPTYTSRRDAISFAAGGPPNDQHEEGRRSEDIGRTSFGVYRRGTYPALHDHAARAKGSLVEDARYYHGSIGVRVDAIAHESVPEHFRNRMYFEGMKDRNAAGCALLFQDQSALVNKHVLYANDWIVRDVQRPYRFEASSNYRSLGMERVIGPDTRTICFEGANSLVEFDRLVIDYRKTATGSACRPIFVSDDGANPYTGNVLRIDSLKLILGDTANKPINLLDLSGTVVGAALALGIKNLSIVNPSAVTLPPLCGSGDYPGLALELEGMDCIELDVAAPQTTLTTAMKAFRRLHRPFVPAAYRAYVSTVSSSGLPTFDVNKNGTSVFGANKLSIDANETSSTTAATAATIQTSSLTPFVAGDVISVDTDVAGTGTAGAVVHIYGWFV